MPNNANYDVGVFYAPLWNYKDPANPLSGKWGEINDYDAFLSNKGEGYKARIPANIYYPSPQWYDEKMPSVTSSQMQLMSDHEIDFVVFDSYWQYYAPYQGYGDPYSHVLDNIRQGLVDFHGVKYALMWAADFTQMLVDNGCDNFFQSGGGLDQMLDHWKPFLQDVNNYKTIDVIENGVKITKKVFYIYYPGTSGTHSDSIEGMCGYCKDNAFFAPLGAAADEPYLNNIKTQYLLNYIQDKLGVGPIYFVAVITPPLRAYNEPPISKDYELKYDWLINHPQLSGYSALTSYGYKYFEYEDAYNTTQTQWCNGQYSYHNQNYDYAKMQAVYQRFYNYMLNSVNHSNSTLDYQVPVSAGFHSGPENKFFKEQAQNILNNTSSTTTERTNAAKKLDDLKFADSCNDYTKDPGDQAVSTPATFQQSLQNARDFADANPVKTKKTIMISAWNEYSEGTVIEPTYNQGTQYLDAVKTVFQ